MTSYPLPANPTENQQERFRKILAVQKLARVNAEYRSDVLDDPRQALENAGIELDEDDEIVVVEDTDTRVHLVLPPTCYDPDCSADDDFIIPC